MAEKANITKDDIYLKARLMSEGVRMQGVDLPSFQELSKSCYEIDLPKKINMDDIEEIMGLFHASIQSDSTNLDVMGNRINLEFNNLRVPLYPISTHDWSASLTAIM